MSKSVERLAALIEERFAGRVKSCRIHVDEVTVEVEAARLHEVMLELRDEDDLGFRQLVDLCGVDYLEYGRSDWEGSDRATSEGFSRGVQPGSPSPGAGEAGRFAAVYHLLSHQNNRRLRVRCRAEGEPPRVESVVSLWPAADWFEREAFDLYGILFVGHPDLRRILTDYGFIGHPFRKDFPLSGEVEMRYDPQRGRVVYEPVSIEPRTLVPRVIRRDERYTRPDPAPEPGNGSDA